MCTDGRTGTAHGIITRYSMGKTNSSGEAAKDAFAVASDSISARCLPGMPRGGTLRSTRTRHGAEAAFLTDLSSGSLLYAIRKLASACLHLPRCRKISPLRFHNVRHRVSTWPLKRAAASVCKCLVTAGEKNQKTGIPAEVRFGPVWPQLDAVICILEGFFEEAAVEVRKRAVAQHCGGRALGLEVSGRSRLQGLGVSLDRGHVISCRNCRVSPPLCVGKRLLLLRELLRATFHRFCSSRALATPCSGICCFFVRRAFSRVSDGE